MTVGCPYNSVGIVVYDDRDVLVTFAIACLVNAYMNKAVKPLHDIMFKITETAADTVT